MQSSAKTVEEYIDSLAQDRQEVMKVVRKIILENLPKGYEEVMNWGMITYQIPLEMYPETYNGQPLGYVALASQKHHFSLYLLGVYGSKKIEGWFRSEFEKAGKKLNMGKSCVRFKKLSDLPLDLIGKTIGLMSVEQTVAHYESVGRGKKASI